MVTGAAEGGVEPTKVISKHPARRGAWYDRPAHLIADQHDLHGGFGQGLKQQCRLLLQMGRSPFTVLPPVDVVDQVGQPGGQAVDQDRVARPAGYGRGGGAVAGGASRADHGGEVSRLKGGPLSRPAHLMQRDAFGPLRVRTVRHGTRCDVGNLRVRAQEALGIPALAAARATEDQGRAHRCSLGGVCCWSRRWTRRWDTRYPADYGGRAGSAAGHLTKETQVVVSDSGQGLAVVRWGRG